MSPHEYTLPAWPHPPEGYEPTELDIDFMALSDVRIRMPNGMLLMVYLRGAIDEATVRSAERLFAWHDYFKLKMAERTVAAGSYSLVRGRQRSSPKSTWVASHIVGFMEATSGGGRQPYSRMTKFGRDFPEAWDSFQTYMKAVADVGREVLPGRMAGMQRYCDAKIHPDFVIPGTPFTTLTVNRDWQTRLHTDSGNYITKTAGIACISAFRKGHWQGGLTCFPKYRVAVSLRPGDLCFMNNHEMHGNTAFKDFGPGCARTSVVMYTRTKLAGTLSAREEMEAAKRRMTPWIEGDDGPSAEKILDGDEG